MIKNTKIILTILIISAIIFININPSIVLSKDLKQELSSTGLKTYYISNHIENKLVIDLLKARRESDALLVYSGNIAQNEYDYLDDIENFPITNKENLYYTDYGYGITYGNSMIQQSYNNGKRIIRFSSNFLETDEETQYVFDKIHTAIKENINNLNTDYEKAYWAYNWVIDNLYYDQTYENRTSYKGLIGEGTVCSGYATLYYAVATELGLDCRYISGTLTDNNDSHAWNIIKLNDKWYCVDTTLGDSKYRDKFFLKSKDTFSSTDYYYHKSDMYANYIGIGYVFSVNDFNKENITIDSRYMLPSVYNVKIDVYKKYNLKVGNKYQFLIDNIDCIELNFTSSNLSVAKVNKKGIITGIKKGISTISVYNDDLKISQSVDIIVR